MSKAKVAKKSGSGLTRLHELDAEEVSLVPQGANRRRFMIAKSAGSTMDATTLSAMKQKIEKSDPAIKAKVSESIKVYKSADGKPLSEEVKKALSVAATVLAPFGNDIPAELAAQVLGNCGVKIEKLGTPGKKPVQPTGQEPIGKASDDEGDSDEGDDDMVEKAMVGPDPSGKVEKTKDGDDEDDKVDAKGATKKSADCEKPPVAKSAGTTDKGERVSKSADEATTREKEAVAKAHKELVAKVAGLQEQLAERDRRDREKELVQKAASWEHLAIDESDVVEQLKLADAAGKEPFERVCKSFERLNEQGRSSGMFSEIGSSQGGNAGSPAAKLEQYVQGYVAKSGGSMTPEQAYVKALETEEGRRLYKDTQAQRPGGV